MENNLKQEIKEYLKNNLKIIVEVNQDYPEYCSTSYASVTVSLLLENEEISKYISDDDIAIPN